jgi:K(+)-stimulated pyrophosphate-energized sodium pump
MSELPKEVRTRTDILILWGIRLQQLVVLLLLPAALTSLALFAAYVTFTGIDGSILKHLF